ncbi:hypothetical protein OPKNFCMD_2150 [Methylobacterium crusticola]|uniref:Uncharacterized protein n=2 Tax=Methylobacterium crusticola TaxID=1697972 RepID=A0ABQ4QXG2_9HYPH|nr:hypothetical protein OPKNFCMD_2150 [Methylobacterium crusticola]
MLGPADIEDMLLDHAEALVASGRPLPAGGLSWPINIQAPAGQAPAGQAVTGQASTGQASTGQVPGGLVAQPAAVIGPRADLDPTGDQAASAAPASAGPLGAGAGALLTGPVCPAR